MLFADIGCRDLRVLREKLVELVKKTLNASLDCTPASLDINRLEFDKCAPANSAFRCRMRKLRPFDYRRKMIPCLRNVMLALGGAGGVCMWRHQIRSTLKLEQFVLLARALQHCDKARLKLSKSVIRHGLRWRRGGAQSQLLSENERLIALAHRWEQRNRGSARM